MYYGLITAAVLMFGVQFYFNDCYQKRNGTGAVAAMTYSLIGALVGILCFCVIGGFNFSVTPFTLVWATVTAVNALLCGICTLGALARVNLSVYSLFSMLGGMLLPFAAGLLFYREPMTLAKGVCFLLVAAALAVTLDRSRVKGGIGYYVGVFVFNGTSGVLSKIYGDATLPKVDSTGYSLWTAILSALLSALVLLLLRKQWKRPSALSLLFGAGAGAMNRLGNLLLLIALAFLPASVQYPFVTGGVVIVSTAIAALTKQKPTRKELLSVALSFAGILALVCIPI